MGDWSLVTACRHEKIKFKHISVLIIIMSILLLTINECLLILHANDSGCWCWVVKSVAQISFKVVCDWTDCTRLPDTRQIKCDYTDLHSF